MINLLPPNQKTALLYARRNTLLMRWLIALSIVAVVATVVLFLGRTYLQAESRRYVAITENTRAELKAQNLEEAQDRIEGISGNLKLIIQVLSRQIIFSELIKQIGVVIPEGAVLSDIEISKTEGGLDLEAAAVNYDTATQVQVNLADPANKLFDKVDLVSVKCEGGEAYPCIVKVRALFSEDNPYLFVNQDKAGS